MPIWTKPPKQTNEALPLVGDNKKITAAEFNELTKLINDNFQLFLAPEDGNIYGRRNGNWVQIISGGNGGTTLHSGLTLDDGTNPHSTTKFDVGLGNVDNTPDLDKPVSTAQAAALNLKLSTNLKGANNGLAELDSNGFVLSSQLPSFVDDVLEFTNFSSLPSTGESGKIYVAVDTNVTYRWSGSSYINLSNGNGALVLGETSSTAYRGDRGKEAYDHSQLTNSNPHGVTPGLISGFVAAVRDSLLTGIVFTSSTLITATDTILQALGKIQAQLSLKLNKSEYAFLDTNSNTVQFDRARKYGFPTPRTGNILFSFTNAIEGQTQYMAHNSNTKPTMPSNVNLLSGKYITGVVNKIAFIPIKISSSPDVWQVDVTVSQQTTW